MWKFTAEVVEFLTEHVEKASTAKQIKTCKFKTDKAAVLTDCIDISKNLEDDDAFISATADMTARLFNFMKASTSRSSGTVIFINYNNVNTGRNHLGLLKMDPNTGIEFDPVNHTFKVRQNMLPTVRERLHKTAFIKLEENLFTEDSHLYVLDKQQTTDTVSHFFMTSFLEAEEVINDKKMVNIVDSTLMKFATEDKIAEGINPFEFKKEVDSILANGNEFDFDNDVEKLLKKRVDGEENVEKLINEIKKSIKDEFEDAYFQFPVKRKETTAYVNSKDKNIKFQFPMSLYNKTVFVKKINENGKVKTVITIEGEDMSESYK
jgi:hypothetical protein